MTICEGHRLEARDRARQYATEETVTEHAVFDPLSPCLFFMILLNLSLLQRTHC
jgi:hypothetical protein